MREWQPIETVGFDQRAILWTPKERLYTPETIASHPDVATDDMRVGTRRWWGWATHWMPLPDPPRGNTEEKTDTRVDRHR